MIPLLGDLTYKSISGYLCHRGSEDGEKSDMFRGALVNFNSQTVLFLVKTSEQPKDRGAAAVWRDKTTTWAKGGSKCHWRLVLGTPTGQL
jgi:hypothetical protein